MTRKKRKGGKLDAKWTGPFKITASLARRLYKLTDYNDPEIVIPYVSGFHLKKYNHPSKSHVRLLSLSSLMIDIRTLQSNLKGDEHSSKLNLNKQSEESALPKVSMFTCIHTDTHTWLLYS